MPVTIARKTLSRFAVGAAIAIALSACSPTDGAETTNSSDAKSSPASASASASSGNKNSGTAASPTSKSASPTPIAASSDGPAKNWPVPKIPAKAKKKTLRGSASFAEYFFELIQYTSVTNQTKPIKKYSEDSCTFCQENMIGPSDRNRKNNAWNAGGAYQPTITAAKFTDDGGALVSYKFFQDKRYVYNHEGTVTAIYAKTERPVYGTFSLSWDDGWQVQSINLVES
ncbi:DUF6318 family protein [Arthrobacter rhombi]